MSTGGYPLGAQYDSRAPYNEKPLPEEEVEVLVSITLSKSFKIKVSDYSVVNGKLDLSDTDLKSAVEEQIVLPNEAYKLVIPFYPSDAVARHDLKDWNVDEFEVILNN